MPPSARLSPVLAALLGALAISFSAIFFRLADVGPVTAAFFRMAYALPALALLWWRRRTEDGRSGRERLLALATGLFLTGDLVAWHASIELIGAGLATLVVNSQVVLVPLATWALLGERPARLPLLAMPVVMAGLALITGLGREDAFGDRPLLGVVLSVLAAGFYSAFLVGQRRSNRSLAPAAGPLFDAGIGALIGTAASGLLLGGLDPVPSWPAHGWLAALALVSQVGGWLAIGHALPRLPATHTSFAILLQPTLTLLWGRLLFGEAASLVQLGGVALVLAGIVAVTLGARQPALPQRPARA